MKASGPLGSTCCALVCVLATTGCFRWSPYEPAAPLSASAGLPFRLRATLADSSRVELTAPFVRADTLYGCSGPDRDTVALSVPDIRRLERERLSVWRTLGVTVGAPAAALAVVFVAVCGEGQCQPDY